MIKVFCPLTISDDNLRKGLDVIEQSMRWVCQSLNKWPDREQYFVSEDAYA